MSPRVFALYRQAPPLAKVHMRVRWATCPFSRIASHVSYGRVLEIGCGHGLFSNHLAITGPSREVLGIDIDDDKVRDAQVAAEQARALGADSRFETAPPGAVPSGPWDTILIVDVLYLISPDRQHELLVEAVSHLADGGTLVVKEMAASPRWKARWNRVQEFVSVRLLRITAGDRIYGTDARSIRSWLETAGLVVEEVRLDRGYPHPHLLLIGKRR